MTNKTILAPAAMLVLLASSCTTRDQSSESSKGGGQAPAVPGQARYPVFEGYPTEIALRVAARQELIRRSREGAAPPAGSSGIGLQYVLVPGTRWEPGSVIRVAFNGGNEQLHREIETVAGMWTNHGNIGFDFGHVPGKGYRTFPAPAGSAEPAARIRISFVKDGIYDSFWSCVGREGENGVCAASPAASMNFGGLDERSPEGRVPIILHEFGHALGFAHEHQNPEGGCDAEFRWDDDPKYILKVDERGSVIIPDSNKPQPGLYTILNGYPNGWKKEKTDANLRKFPSSSAYETTALDKLSIMKYPFGAWMFRNGTESKCYNDEPNRTLSALDQAGALRLYPRTPASMISTLDRTAAAMARVERSPATTLELKTDMKRRLDALRDFRSRP